MGILALLSLFALSYSQLLGIDLGTLYTKVAMVQPGAGLSFAILENTKSERKIETAVNKLKFRSPSGRGRGSTRVRP